MHGSSVTRHSVTDCNIYFDPVVKRVEKKDAGKNAARRSGFDCRRAADAFKVEADFYERLDTTYQKRTI